MGLAAPASDKDGDAVLDHTVEQFAQGRPPHAVNLVCHRVFHQVGRLADQRDLRSEPCVERPASSHKRERGTGGVIGTKAADI